MTITIDRALLIASICHLGQYYGIDEPYINHCLRVADGVEGDHQKCVALLHDTLEDSPMTYPELRDMVGFDIAQDVFWLTRIPGERYEEYINRIKPHPQVIPIKLADLNENLKWSQVRTEYSSLITRYRTAIYQLEQVRDGKASRVAGPGARVPF